MNEATNPATNPTPAAEILAAARSLGAAEVVITGVDGAFPVLPTAYPVEDAERFAAAWENACARSDMHKVRGKTAEAWAVVGGAFLARYYGRGKFNAAMSVLG